MATTTKEVSVVLTGKNASALTAIKEVESQASKSAGNSSSAFEKSTTKTGGFFSKLDAQLGSFGVPLAGATAKAGGELEQLGGKGNALASVFSGAGSAGVAGAVAAAGAVVIKFGVDSVQAASQFQTAHARLVTAAGNTGQAFSQFASSVQGTDDKLTKLGFTETDTESSLAQLVGATHDVSKAQGLMGLAADIARGRNIALSDATNILVKVETGHVGLLGKLGIATKDATGHTISQQEAIQRVTAIYGGQAQAYLGTYAGKVAQLSAEYDQLKVTIGEQVIPVLGEFAGEAQSTLGVFQTVSGSIDKVTGHTNELSHAVINSLPGFSQLNALGSARNAIFGDSSKKTDAATKATEALTQANKKYANDVASNAAPQKLAADARAVTDAQTKQNTITKALTNAQNAATGSTNDLADATDQQKLKTADLVPLLERAGIGFQNEAAGLKIAQDAAVGNASAVDALQKHLQSLIDTTLAAAGSELSQEKNVNAVGAAINSYKDKITALQKAKAGDTQASLDASNAAIDLNSSILQVASGAVQNAKDIDAEAAAQGRAKTAIQQVNDQHDAEYKALENLAKIHPELRGQISQTEHQLGLWPPTESTRLTITADASQATNEVTTLLNTLNIAANSARGLAIIAASIQPGGGGGNARKRAAGGPVAEGTPYLIGEQGPELFVPKSSGTIIPNNKLGGSGRSLGGSTGTRGGDTYNITVNTLDAHTAGDVVIRAIQDYNRTKGPANIKVTAG